MQNSCNIFCHSYDCGYRYTHVLSCKFKLHEIFYRTVINVDYDIDYGKQLKAGYMPGSRNLLAEGLSSLDLLAGHSHRVYKCLKMAPKASALLPSVSYTCFCFQSTSWCLHIWLVNLYWA